MECTNNPAISIIVPIYNCSACIQRCVDSIHLQTFDDYEVILVNDGSTDDSLQKCLDIKKTDCRINVINKPNGGAGSARNVGIEAALGKYIYFFDADDEISATLLQKAFSVAEKNNADLVVFSLTRKVIDCCSGSVLSEKDIPKTDLICSDIGQFRTNFSHLYYEGYLFGGPVNKLFRRNIIRDYEISYPDLKRGQDEIFNFRYYLHTKVVAFIPEALYTYYAYDQKSKNLKYRSDYFEKTKAMYYNNLKMIFDEFDLQDEYTRTKYDNSFVYSLEDGFMLAWNPIDHFSSNEKRQHIDRILHLDFVLAGIEKISYIPIGYDKFWDKVRTKDAIKIYNYLETNVLIGKLKNSLRGVLR